VRRADLVVDAEYYHDKSPNWATRHYGNRAVVVATEPHKDYRDSWGREPRIRPVTTGNGVLVDLYHISFDRVKDPTPVRSVVSLTSLRGPWAETNAACEAVGKAQRQQYEAASAKMSDLYRIRDDMTIRAEQLGVQVHHARTREDLDTITVELTLDTFVDIVTRLEAAQ
jgi:hypothetical protein